MITSVRCNALYASLYPDRMVHLLWGLNRDETHVGHQVCFQSRAFIRTLITGGTAVIAGANTSVTSSRPSKLDS